MAYPHHTTNSPEAAPQAEAFNSALDEVLGILVLHLKPKARQTVEREMREFADRLDRLAAHKIGLPRVLAKGACLDNVVPIRGPRGASRALDDAAMAARLRAEAAAHRAEASAIRGLIERAF